ncbi:MAG: M28 family peptidase [Armatimonadota bacterium]|nr:MAG: M28 family peptidase [Armatimonadota bacterium]
MRAGRRWGARAGRRVRCHPVAPVSRLLFVGLVGALAGLMSAPPCFGVLGKKEPTAEQQEWWVKFAEEVEIKNLERYVGKLSESSPRLAGYPGAEKAAEYIAAELQRLGLKDASKQEITDPGLGKKLPYREVYWVTVPWVWGQPTLEVLEGGEVVESYDVFPLWPNLVRTSQLAEGGEEYQLIDGGDGRPVRFSGQDVEGTAALMEFKCGSNWLNAPRLGARAVIFVEPEKTTRGEAEAKFLRIPVNIPRFWIGRSDAYRLRARLKSQPEVVIRIKCRMTWERRHAWNVVAEIPGTDDDLKDQTVYVTAYYDSMSIVPQISPGAESASGAAALLELARILTKYPPKRTVRMVFNGAHFLGLAGIRNYVATHLDELIDGVPVDKRTKFLGLIPYTKTVREKMAINLFLALDLSTQNDKVGVFYKGMFYDQREDTDISRHFSDFARTLRENATLMSDWGTNHAEFADGVNPIYGKPWRTFIFGKIALDNEPITLGGGRGAAFVTTDDARPRVDTPFDTVDWVNFQNLERQTEFLAATMWDIVTDPKMPIDKEPSFQRMSVTGGFAELSVRALAFDPKKSIVADKVIKDERGEPTAMVVARMSDSTLMGTRGDLVEITDGEGRSHFWGYPTINAYGWRKPSYIEAYNADAITGDINYAPDWGPMGNRHHPRDPTQFFITAGKKDFTIVVFECVPIALYDLVDPQSLTTMTYIKIYDGLTDAEPRRYGLTIPHPEPWRGHVEDVALVFADPGQRVKVMMGLGAGSVRMLLLDAKTVDEENQSGLGYLADEPFALAHTPLRVTEDMWALDEMRMQKLARFRIVNEIVKKHHEDAKKLLDEANAALAARDYRLADGKARAAWGYEARAYPAVLSTMNDVVKGVLFYLALMLPFAFFTERLVFAFPNLRLQIVGFVGVFAAICLVFGFIHPAFEITNNPWIVPLAFIMVALSVLVITLVTMKFEDQLKMLQMKVSGVHRADIGRMSVAAAAFSLGISNMRKRRARTVFTCLTLVLLTFTVLSFTSVKTGTKYNERKAKGEPAYQGLLVRNAMWEPLEESAYRVLNDEFGRERAVAPRAWFFTSKTEEQSFMTVSTDATDATYDARAVTGLSAAEPEVTGLDEALTAGRWFEPEDVHAAIIPTRMAEAFHIKPADVGKVNIFLGGIPYDLIGIMNASEAKRRVDLDQEPLTPVDWIQMQRMSRQGGGQQAQQGQKSGFQEYLHLSPDQVVFVPFETALNLGAEVESVAVSFGPTVAGKAVDPELVREVEARAQQVRETLWALMPRLGFNLYAGTGDEIRKWSAIGRTSILGLEGVLIPILIAALIVLNTMLGAVYERVREIHIFSSIGLAPSHIAMLFLAESFVYAILGAIFGYLIGQGTAKLITAFDLLPGLYLNYSSVAAVASTTVVIGVVMLSTMYPARKASEVATPAIERSWQLPEPVGDSWDIPLPFAVTGEQATALTRFMVEWFEAYEEYSIGDFVTQDVKSWEEESEHGTSYIIQLMSWVAPFDLGVSQQVQLRTIPTDMEDVFEIGLHLERVSGDVSSWRRVNRRFLNTLRKQFLIWRTLRAEERDRYLGLRAAGTAEAAS